MHRFLVPPEALEKSPVVIVGPQARHIATVLRLKPGDRITLLDGRGQVADAVIVACDRGRIEARVVTRLPSSSESPLELTVAQAFLKAHKMDTVIRHLTELGVHRWLPFASRRSVARPAGPRLQRRTARWQDIAGEAVKQCRRSRLPHIHPADSLEAVLAAADSEGLKIIFWEKEHRGLSSIIASPAQTPGSVFLIIGPEGGFEADEIRAAAAHGFQTASLGPRILRAETAALTACALIQHVLGDLG
jgi:16S rRNA (uracil1498-N3)-methyltransferase